MNFKPSLLVLFVLSACGTQKPSSESDVQSRHSRQIWVNQGWRPNGHLTPTCNGVVPGSDCSYYPYQECRGADNSIWACVSRPVWTNTGWRPNGHLTPTCNNVVPGTECSYYPFQECRGADNSIWACL